MFERFKARHREKADAPQKTELITLKLSFHGIGIDLKELARRSTNWWRRKAKRKGISFVSNDRHCHWSVVKLNDQSGTFVNGRWHVTNSSESDVKILKARLGEYEKTPFFEQLRTHHPEDKRPIFGDYPIQSHRMAEISVDLTFIPPIGRAPKPIISDVIFTDNFGNEHRARTRFPYIGSDKPT